MGATRARPLQALTCPPRWGTEYRGGKSRGATLTTVAKALGWELFPWQTHVATVAMELGADGYYRYSTVGVQVGRQNGKTALVCARIAMEALRPMATIVYTAQDRNLARTKWEEHTELLMASPMRQRIRQVVRANGQERIIFDNGARYLIVTPNRTGGRGLSCDLAVIDEAFAHGSLAPVSALEPTLATRPDGQLWLCSQAGDENSALLAHYRDAGRQAVETTDTTLAWFEWAPEEDDADHRDPETWRQAIPSMGLAGGVTVKAVKGAAATNDEELFRREWLDQWTARAVSQVIPWDRWVTLNRADVTIGADVCLGVDVSVDRSWAAIGAAGRVGGYFPLEVVAYSEGTGWVAAKLAEVAKRWGAKVVIDAGGPAGGLIQQMVEAGVTVEGIGARDYSRACVSFYDAVVDAKVTHLDDYRLNDAIKGADRRTLGDSWAWGRKAQRDVTCLVAVTLARWGLHGPEQPEPGIW